MKTAITIQQISAQAARPLRGAILRPGQPPENLVYPGDDDPDSFHAGAYLDGELVGVASISRQPPPGEDDPHAWRLRGMAVAETARCMGVGRLLVARCLKYIAAKAGERLWCNGRVSALAFYHKLGFQEQGEIFDVPESGPHYVLARRVHPLE